MNLTEEKKEIMRREYKELEFLLEELQKKKKGKYTVIIGVLISICCTVIFGILACEMVDRIDIWTILISVILGMVMGVFSYFYILLSYEMKESRIRRNMIYYETEDVKEEVEEDIFENSIKMSYKYLDQYYLQTREQAQRGFFITICVAIFGGVLVGIGVIAMFFGVTQPSYVTCGAGVITEFIAAVFFYLYNRTVSSMSKYHNKLVISQNVSIALKVADSLPTDDKVKAKNKIIEELLKDVNIHLVKSDTDN